jgi:hypothetical protein
VSRAALVLLCVTLVSGCGGRTVTTTVTQTAPAPTIPKAVAVQLAAGADAVAAALDRGDTCAARQAAEQLRADTIAAINRHDVPGAFQETLLARAQDLAAEIECTPPPEPARGNGKGHGKAHARKGKG